MSWIGVGIGLGLTVAFLGIIFFILWLFPNENRETTVPGLEPSSDDLDDAHNVMVDIEGEKVPSNIKIRGEHANVTTTQPRGGGGPDRKNCRNGNLGEIALAGDLHNFLMNLHRQWGPIIGFWWKTEYTVSITSPELFEQHKELFDRPPELFRMFEPLLTQHSIQTANSTDGRARRLAFDKIFNDEVLHKYYNRLQKIADETVNKWDKAEVDDHFPLGQHMGQFSAKAALVALMGSKSADDREVQVFKKSYDVAWEYMEEQLTNLELSKANSDREKSFKAAVDTLKEVIARAIKDRETRGPDSRDFLLIDAIIAHHIDEERRLADAITYTVLGFHTTANLLTWCIYYLCLHTEIQERLYKEIIAVLEPDEQVTHQSIGSLRYVRQVLNETLRRAVVVPWTARYCPEDMDIAGHTIFAGTPVIQALGVTMMDDRVFPAAKVFDPDRFSEKMKCSTRHPLAYTPFGFAGRRSCPAQEFAYIEATLMLVTVVRKFRFRLVPGQDVKPQRGLVSHPKDEIWFKVFKRETPQTEA